MKRKLLLIVFIMGIFGAFSLPVVNLIFPNVPPEAANQESNPEFKPIAELLAKKCQDCHSLFTKYPWYFNLPLTKSMMVKDVEAGKNVWDISAALTSSYGNFTVAQLAMLETVLYQKSMPPVQYKLLHWNSRINEENISTLQNFIRKQRSILYPKSGTSEKFKGEILQPVMPAENLDNEIVKLGNTLYHDNRLSGDGSLSCASCHGLAKGGTDQAKVSTGIRGQLGGINAPTVYNSSLNFLQFWDGRAKDLETQALGPVENPIEMGAKWEEVVLKLKEDVQFSALFETVMKEPLSKEAIARAIATFEKSLKTVDSKFDLYLKGDDKAISEEEQKGFELFKKTGCASCHFGEGIGGTHFEKMGKKRDYFAARGNIEKADFGKFNFTAKEEDKFYFKVPLLRNIELTLPYFHDGSVKELSEAVSKMGRYQLNNPLTQQEVDSITAFLKTLTGKSLN